MIIYTFLLISMKSIDAPDMIWVHTDSKEPILSNSVFKFLVFERQNKGTALTERLIRKFMPRWSTLSRQSPLCRDPKSSACEGCPALLEVERACSKTLQFMKLRKTTRKLKEPTLTCCFQWRKCWTRSRREHLHSLLADPKHMCRNMMMLEN